VTREPIHQFNTQAGETFSKRTTSWEVRLFKEGMQIPVFYDPSHPKKQVALLAAYYEPDLPKRADAPKLRLTATKA
jgi:hypothetical protein